MIITIANERHRSYPASTPGFPRRNATMRYIVCALIFCLMPMAANAFTIENAAGQPGNHAIGALYFFTSQCIKKVQAAPLDQKETVQGACESDNALEKPLAAGYHLQVLFKTYPCDTNGGYGLNWDDGSWQDYFANTCQDDIWAKPLYSDATHPVPQKSTKPLRK